MLTYKPTRDLVSRGVCAGARIVGLGPHLRLPLGSYIHMGTHTHQSFTSCYLLSKRDLNWMPDPHTQAQKTLFGPDHLEHDMQTISFRKEDVDIASYIPPSPIPTPCTNAVSRS